MNAKQADEFPPPDRHGDFNREVGGQSFSLIQVHGYDSENVGFQFLSLRHSLPTNCSPPEWTRGEKPSPRAILPADLRTATLRKALGSVLRLACILQTS